MKKLTLLLASVVTFGFPAAAIASEPEQMSFDHDGAHYVYTITEQGSHQVIAGLEERSGKRFKLRVGEKRVTGVVGSTPVSFRRSEAVAAIPANVIAQR